MYTSKCVERERERHKCSVHIRIEDYPQGILICMACPICPRGNVIGRLLGTESWHRVGPVTGWLIQFRWLPTLSPVNIAMEQMAHLCIFMTYLLHKHADFHSYVYNNIAEGLTDGYNHIQSDLMVWFCLASKVWAKTSKNHKQKSNRWQPLFAGYGHKIIWSMYQWPFRNLQLEVRYYILGSCNSHWMYPLVIYIAMGNGP